MPSNLFSAGQIGTMTLPNRVIRSATQDPFGHRDGTCAPEQVALYRDIAAAGTGAIITAYSYISPEARSTGIQVGFATEEQRASQKEVLDAVHEAGGRLILQLMHAGMNVFMPEKHVAGGKLLAPTGGLKAPNDMETTEITAEDMAKIKADFVDAAKAAKELGFDGIQLHCAHGYLLSQFLDPNTNQRTDAYGGSAENRARFAVEAVRAVRSRLPELPIDYKLAVRQEDPHYGNAGVLESELGIFVPLLVEAGVTSFHVTLANHSSLEDTIPPANHPYFKGEGCFLKFCDEVRQYTDKPITGVGGLTNPDFVEAQLASGRITCAAMSRQLLADPAWPNKAAAGQVQAIHRCVRCNKKCLGGLQQHQGTHCIYEKTGA